MFNSRRVSATMSLPQPGAFATASFTGRSSSRSEGWAMGAAGALAAAAVFAVVTAKSLGSEASIGSLSPRLTQARQKRHAGIAVGGLHADLALEILRRLHGVVADAPVDAAGIETERGEPLLDFLDFGERRRAF